MLFYVLLQVLQQFGECLVELIALYQEGIVGDELLDALFEFPFPGNGTGLS